MSQDDDARGRITTEAHGHVLAIGIDRPKKLNGFTLKMLGELARAYDELERNDDHRVALVFAHGANFTAGLQLDEVGPHMARGNPCFPVGSVDPMSLRPPLRTKPVVCAVQGICFTIGIELMLACDVVVAADNCRFAQIEVKRGIMPTGGATMRFVERAGWGNAQRYLLTGDAFDAAIAYRLGFVQEVVPAGSERAAALAIAERIAAQAPLAVRASLASSRRYVERGPVGHAAEMDDQQRILGASADAAEGIRSFLEKRPAKFLGR
jgi:enoyl-CoA hydratase